jgi:hypothetical protein
MLPIYAARIEDLAPGDLMKVDCAARARRLPATVGQPALAQ